jgi:hypothetical protein
MKVQLELVINDDGRRFLNFWNHENGDDVCCEILDGKLISDNGEGGETTMLAFIERVEERVENWRS